jgi:sugar phosphate isomerase/epimerase
MKPIRIGTLLKGLEEPAAALAALAAGGFESWSLTFWESVGRSDLPRLADGILAAIDSSPELPGGGRAAVSSLSIYGNPLRDDETGEEIRRSWRALIDCAPLFAGPSQTGRMPGSAPDFPIVSGFAGRLPGSGVEASIQAWRKLFSGLAERAEKKGARLAFENCRMGDTWKTGKWNIAVNADAWELMFAALDAHNIGLEWEPCHQVEALADPLPQLAAWAPKVFHVHGKDARIDRALVAERGLYGARKFHESCLPGNGDTDWKEVFRILEASGYAGAIDIEGWNDAIWSREREIEGQLRALAYLKRTRGD